MWTSLCELDELIEDRGHYVEIDGFRLAVFRHQGRVYVIDNTCPHVGASLTPGQIIDHCVVCPRHNWAFQLENGQLKHAPGIKIDTYQVRMLERLGAPTLVQADLPMC